MLVSLRVEWPNGSVAFMDLLTYCTMDQKLLEGTTARLVSEESENKREVI